MHITAWRSALLLLTTMVCCQGADPAGRPPNLIVILADDLGWADLGCYGSQFHQTPRLDRIAREGIRFTDAYAAIGGYVAVKADAPVTTVFLVIATAMFVYGGFTAGAVFRANWAAAPR